MKAIVVYESLWGNTAAIARAIAEGIGPEAKALSTAEATAAEVADADLIVAGAPIFGFQLPTEQSRENIARNPGKAPSPPNLSAPSMRSWIASAPEGKGKPVASFETRIWWSLGSSAKTIAKLLQRKGYRLVSRPMKFIVTGGYGPLREGEPERARLWGKELAGLMGSRESAAAG